MSCGCRCDVIATPVGEIQVAKKMEAVGSVIGGEGAPPTLCLAREHCVPMPACSHARRVRSAHLLRHPGSMLSWPSDNWGHDRLGVCMCVFGVQGTAVSCCLTSTLGATLPWRRHLH